jgi:hypothetical protein
MIKLNRSTDGLANNHGLYTPHQHSKGEMGTPSLTGEGRPQMPLHATFQAQAGTSIDPATFRKPAGMLPHMKDRKCLAGLEHTAVRGKWFEVNDFKHTRLDGSTALHMF